MAKRLLDVTVSALGLVLAAPVLAIAAVGIRLSSPGPLLYRARRVGRKGMSFTMYKLRTMHRGSDQRGGRITGLDDPRVFPFGGWLRRTKIDEIPQLLNVLRGEMSLVGPRPEDPDIVARHYAPVHRETLRVRPGLASPASLYDYTHGTAQLAGPDPEAIYVARLFPFMLALEVVYVRHASLRYDITIIGRTLWTIATRVLGRRRFPDPPETQEAQKVLAEQGSVYSVTPS